jgi:hypothetical protein
MTLAKSFEPADIERRWYPEWESRGYFAAGLDTNTPNKPNFCILLPPPNVTGTLHMGHGFNQTLMDALTRYHRMRGDNTLWQPGTDHAGIATQIVVERQLDAQGISRHDLGREAFVKKVWEWKEFSGSTITRQMRRLGTSPDWTRERFTMDEGLSKTVTQTFVRLHERRSDLPRQASGELGSGAGHRRVRPRGGAGRGGRLAVAHPLSAGRRHRSSDRRHHPSGNHAGRRRGHGASGRRALRRADRQDGEAAADRPPKSRSSPTTMSTANSVPVWSR